MITKTRRLTYQHVLVNKRGYSLILINACQSERRVLSNRARHDASVVLFNRRYKYLFILFGIRSIQVKVRFQPDLSLSYKMRIRSPAKNVKHKRNKANDSPKWQYICYTYMFHLYTIHYESLPENCNQLASYKYKIFCRLLVDTANRDFFFF